MIDRIYKTVQSEINKEQLGYLKPMKFNLYVNNSIYNIFNKLISDVKTQGRKSNWMLDGKNLADYSELTKQLLEYYLIPNHSISKTEDNKYFLPEECEFIQTLYTENGTRIDKVDMQDFFLLKRNNYASPNNCRPIYFNHSRELSILPEIDTVLLSYIRKPKKAKWTFIEDEGKPMFDPTQNDFQDVDIPESLSNEIIIDVLSQAGITIRDNSVLNFSNQEEAKEIQIENKQ